MINKIPLLAGSLLLLAGVFASTLGAQTPPLHVAPSITDAELEEMNSRLAAEPPEPAGEADDAPGRPEGGLEGEISSPGPAFGNRGSSDSPFESEKFALRINDLRAEGKQLKKKRDQKAERFTKMVGNRNAAEEALIKAYQELSALNAELDRKRLEFVLANRRKNPYWSPKTFNSIDRDFVDYKAKSRVN